MGTYSHYSDQKLSELRDKLTDSLHEQLTAPSAQAWGDRRVQFDRKADDLRKQIAEVNAEIALRSGRGHGPIYLV